MAKPCVEIIEQPAEKSIRFRYASEGRLNGSLFGSEATRDCASYPKIKIGNVTGTVVILISCVTNDQKQRQHPHKLSTKNKILEGGIYALRKQINGSAIIEFKDIGIVAIKKQDIKTSLEERLKMKVDPTNGGWSHMSRPQFIDLHSVRLCFQVLLDGEKCDGNNKQVTPLGYVVSNPIIDRKSNGLLKIIEMSSYSSSVMGGERIMMITEKVKREDIAIVFYEEDAQKKVIWKNEINYMNSTMKVHHQYTILFNAPAFKDFDITGPRKIFVQISRPSDQECSESVPFTYVPNEQSIQLKRKKIQKKVSETMITTLTSHKSRSKPNEVKPDKSKYVPNIQENVLVEVEVNRNDGCRHMANPQPLINLDDVDEKENCSASNPMQNQNTQGSFQASMHPQYSNLLCPIAYYRYPQYTPKPNVNSYFDELCHEQTPAIPQNTCIMPTLYHQQQLQQQPNSFNVYGNGYNMNSTMNRTQNMNMYETDYGGQCTNPAPNYQLNPLSNCMAPTYNANNNNMTLNRIDHSMDSTRPMNVNFQPNASHIPELAQHTTSELMNVIMNLPDIDELTNSVENISLESVKPEG